MLRVKSKLIKVKKIHNDTYKEIIALNENYDGFSDHIQQYMNHWTYEINYRIYMFDKDIKDIT